MTPHLCIKYDEQPRVGTSRKTGWECPSRFLKPLLYFRPKSVIFASLFQTWPKIWYPISDLKTWSPSCDRSARQAKCHKKALAFRKSEGEFRGHQREDIWHSLICTSKSKSANCRLKLLRSEVKTSHSIQQQRTSAAKKSLKITHLETRIMKLFHLSCYKHCFITQASSTELFLMCKWDLTDILSDIHWSVKNNRIGYVLHFLRFFFLQITQTNRSPEYP